MQPTNTTSTTYTAKDYLLATLVCLLATTYLLYEFILQVAPAVMTHELMRDLMVDAAGLSSISAFYYLAYTPMQVPAGLLFDRFGPRVLLTLATAVCASGAFAFAYAHGVPLAALGRLLMGFASAFAFIGALVLIANWFPSRYFATLTGVVQLMACAGAIAGEAPLAMAIENLGWRCTLSLIAVAGILLAALVFIIVRDKPKKAPDPMASPAENTSTVTAAAAAENPMNEWQRLKRVCGTGQNGWVALYALFSWWPITLFPSLWGVPFVMAVYGVSASQAALAVSMVWAGIGIGSPLLGWLSDAIGRRLSILRACAVLGVGITGVMLYVSSIPMPVMYGILFLFGVASSGQALSFALVKDNNAADVVGTAIGFNNMAVVLGGVFQFVVGLLLRYTWEGGLEHSVPVYSVHSYQIGLSVLPISYGICCLLSLWALRESYCKPTYKRT